MLKALLRVATVLSSTHKSLNMTPPSGQCYTKPGRYMDAQASQNEANHRCHRRKVSSSRLSSEAMMAALSFSAMRPWYSSPLTPRPVNSHHEQRDGVP